MLNYNTRFLYSIDSIKTEEDYSFTYIKPFCFISLIISLCHITINSCNLSFQLKT